MNCPYSEKCQFYQRKSPIHEAMYATNLQRFCNTNFTACALYVITRDKEGAIIPLDLYPNQSWRVKKIINV